MSVCKKIKLETIEYARCSVAACNNVYSRTMHSKPHVVYYPFPYDKEIREQWRTFCQQADPGYSYNFMCSEHFRIDDYIVDDQGYKKLKFNAIPSIATHKKSVKAEEIEIIDTSEPTETSEYDEYHVYELDVCNSEQLSNQTGDRSNTEETTNVQKAGASENEDEAEDLDEATFDLLEGGNPDADGSPDYFESEAITDIKLRNKMLYEEARTALKLAASLKPPLPPKSSTEDSFGIRVADRLKKIGDEKIYNDTVWAVQKALQEGIEKVKKKKMGTCAVDDDDVIILDSPPPEQNENDDQQNEETQSSSITLDECASNPPKADGKQIRNEEDVVVEGNSNASCDRTISVEDHPEPVTSCSTPLTPALKTIPLFTRVSPVQLENPVATIFSNSAIQVTPKTIHNSNENKSFFSAPSNLEKPSTFQKVILQPRELRPTIPSAFTISDALPRLQCLPNLTVSTNLISQAQITSEKTDIPATNTTQTLPPNITVPIILICPPATQQPHIPLNTPFTNSNVSLSSLTSAFNPNVAITENSVAAPPQASASNQRQTTQPTNAATDILRAVSNLLAASVASPKQ